MVPYGVGFLENVYENALAHEICKSGLSVEQQRQLQIVYDGLVVGDYFADMLVEKKVPVELKAVKTLDNIHMAQCLNYLKAIGLNLCLLLIFGESRLRVKRVVL